MEAWPTRTTLQLEEQLAAAQLRIAELERALESRGAIPAAARQRIAELERALSSRIAIEQAKGVLAERLGMDVGEAFDLLRAAARSHRLRMQALALRVVSERKTPGPIIVALTRGSRLRAAWMREVAEAHRARVEELHIAVHEQMERMRLEQRSRGRLRGDA